MAKQQIHKFKLRLRIDKTRTPVEKQRTQIRKQARQFLAEVVLNEQLSYEEILRERR